MKRTALNEDRPRLGFYVNRCISCEDVIQKRFSHFRPSDLELLPFDLNIALPVTRGVGKVRMFST